MTDTSVSEDREPTPTKPEAPPQAAAEGNGDPASPEPAPAEVAQPVVEAEGGEPEAAPDESSEAAGETPAAVAQPVVAAPANETTAHAESSQAPEAAAAPAESPQAPEAAPTSAVEGQPTADAEAPKTSEPAPTGAVEAQRTADAPAPKPAQPSRPPRPRRRRPTAAERHRRTFFAKLSELRKQEQAALAGGPEPADEGVTETPAAAEEPTAEGATEAPTPEPQPAAPQRQEPPATSPTRSARAQARLVAAIERVGGAEAVREALQPKRRDDGETMKWSSVCAEQAQGHRPGDPVFTAWVRLAATPVRDVKAIVNPRRDDDRRGRRGRRSDGGGYRGGRSDGGGYRGDRSDRGRPARREELETHGRDGSFRSSVRIVHVDANK
jgi:hypothetical protein